MAIKKRIREFINWTLFANPHPVLPPMEAVYQRIVERDLAALKIDERIYPVGSAANYSLLYIIIRAAMDFPIKEVLELGAGQSSILFNALSNSGAIKANVRTLEHDSEWADRVAAAISHEVIRTKLVAQEQGEISFEGYDLAPLSERRVEFLVVDGPPAASKESRFSRLGALGLVEWINPSSFIIIVDDANRAGEILLAQKFEEKLQEKGIKYACGEVVSNKRQIIIAGGDYIGAAYY